MYGKWYMITLAFVTGCTVVFFNMKHSLHHIAVVAMIVGFCLVIWRHGLISINSENQK